MGRFISRLIIPFREMPYLPKWLVLLMDICISMLSFTISYMICYNLLDVPVLVNAFLMKLLLSTGISVMFFIIFKTYSGIIRYSTFMDASRVFFAVFFSNLTLISINFLLTKFFNKAIFLNIGFFINAILAFVLMFSFRMFVKLIHDYFKDSFLTSNKVPILIFGVTSHSVSIARMIKSNDSLNYKLVGFISMTSHAANKTLMGVPVYYGKNQYLNVLASGKVKALLIIPSEINRSTKQEIVDICLENNVQVISPPPISEWVDGKPKTGEMKNIQIEDLLGREPIQINENKIGRELEGKCILVTGAAGSIGSEIVRQVSRFKPSTLILCDYAESPTYEIQLELQEKFPELNFVPLVSDVRNFRQMDRIFSTYRPQYVYHAAAYKHVPLMEEYPSEAVLTNVCGTKNIADLSVKYCAEVFVMVSTDKAVNPSNVMGASKRIAEMYTQSLYQYLQKKGKEGVTRFITTRFGNVLGSNGSVIPRFKDQIAKGGPITVTHPEIIRYFMTIPEACRLVMEASVMGRGGEIFIFDMGEPVKIVDLAERMIRLAGLIPGKDIKIEFTGLRPGEKLYEELLNNKEYTRPTHHEKIMIAAVRQDDYERVSSEIQELVEYAQSYDAVNVVRTMKEIVPEYISYNSNFEVLDKKAAV